MGKTRTVDGGHARFEATLEKLYAAVVDEAAWTPFLDSWIALMGGVGGHFLVWDAAENRSPAGTISEFFGPKVLRDYAE